MHHQNGVYTAFFSYEDASGPLKVCHGKDCVEKFTEHIEGEVKQSYAAFPQQSNESLLMC